MSNERSPREVCSITMGTSGMRSPCPGVLQPQSCTWTGTIAQPISCASRGAEMELGKAGTETVVVHSVERDVELPVEPEEAWEAVSDPERLGHWLGGDVEMDPVPGGEFHIRFDGEDGGERTGFV